MKYAISLTRSHLVLSLLAATAVLVQPVAHASSGNWNTDAAGNWSTAGNWSPAVVPGTVAGDVVGLNVNLASANRTVTIDTTSRTNGTLTIGDPTTPFYTYTLASSGGANLTFNNGGNAANLVQTNNTSTSDTISAPLVLADNLSVTNNSGSTLTLSGVISGAGKSLSKSGAGTLALNGANTFSGGVNLNGGKIILANAASLGATAGTLSIAGGTTLDCSVANLVIANKNPVLMNGNFTFTGTQNLGLGIGAISLGSTAGNRTVTVSANNLTLGGNIADGVATNLTKAGSGTLTLSGTNTYSGGATVSAGALCFLTTNAVPATGTTTVAAGATLGLGVSGAGAFSSTDVDALFAGTFTRVSMNATARVGIDTTAGSFTYATSASGTRGLTKLGTNTLTLTAANTYTGATTINGGVLQLDHETALPGGIGAAGGTSALVFNGGALGLGAGDFTRSLGSATTVTAANFTGAGGWAAYNADRVVNLGGNVTPSTIAWTNATTGFNSKTLILSAATATHTVDLQNPINLCTNATRTVQVDDGAAAIDAQLSGVLSSVANGHLSKTAAGTLALSAENTYMGNTTVQGGTLMVTGTGSLSGVGAITVQGGGTLMVTDAGRIGVGGTNALTVGAATSAGTMQYSSSATSTFAIAVVGQSAANGTLNQTAGFISITGNVNMVTGADGYGTINLSGGTMAVGGALNIAQRGIYPATVNLSGTGVLTAATLVVADFSSGKGSIGQFTQSGGTATVGSILITKSSTDNIHTGTVDLIGGTLSAGFIAAGTTTASTNISTFNFNGGTLKPTASSATFMQGLTAANVKNGGAVIDSDVYDITIGQPLLHFAGATTDSLTKFGAGTLTLAGTNTYMGTTTVNNGTLVLAAAGQLGSGNYAADIINNGAFVFGSSANHTLSGVISGSGTLTKSGEGMLTLTGDSTCAGATALTAGKLAVVTGASLKNSDVTLSSGTTLGVRVLSGGSQWSCKSLTLGSGTTTVELSFYAATPSTTVAPVQVNGDLVNNGTLNVTIASGMFAVGAYPLIHYTGAEPAGSLGSVVLPNGGVATLVSNAGNKTIDLNITTANPALVWAGDTGTWDIDTTANWAGSLTYLDGDAVLFDDTSSGTAPFTVTLATTLNPGSVTVNNPTKDYTLAGPGVLGGEASVFKSGAGTLTLTGANTYSGGTVLDSSAGTVKATVSATQNSLGTGPVAIGAGATLVLDNTNTSGAAVSKANTFTGSGVLTLNFATNTTARTTALSGLSAFAGTVQLASVSSTGDKWDAGGVSAPGVTVKIDSGTTLLLGTLSAAVGSMTVGGLGNSEGRGAIRLTTAATTLAGPITLQGDTTIASDAAGATISGNIAGTAGAGASNILTQGTSASAAGCILSGVISDGTSGGRVVLTQTKGVLTLSSTNAYSGATTINGGGTLQLGLTDALPVTGSVILGGTNGLGNLTLGSFSQTLASLTFGSTNAALTDVVTIGPGQALSISGTGGLLVGVDARTNSTATTAARMAGGGALVVANPSAIVTVGKSQGNQNGGFNNVSTLDLAGLSSVTLGSSGAAISELRVGYGTTCTGTLTLSNTNNLITATTVQIGHSKDNNGGAGTVILGAGTNVLAANLFNIGCSKIAGTLKFASQTAGSPGSVTIGGKTGATADFLIGGKTSTGTGATPIGTLDLRGHLATVAAGTVTIGKEDGVQASGATGSLSFDAGTFTVTNLNLAAKSGPSNGLARATLTVGGGAFTVTTNGSFTLASQINGGTANGALNLSGGTFTCNAHIRGGASNCTTTVTLTGGTLDMTSHSIGLGSQTVSVFTVQSGTLMNLGQFNSGSPLVKTGSGTLTLDGTNTYTGATIVSNGTLRLTGGLCLPPTADLYLVTGTTTQLDYDGVLPLNALYVDGVLKMGSLYGQNNLAALLSGTGYLKLPQQATVLWLR